MTFKLGLTGSIGMGKSTTAAIFKDLGCAVWDADAAVHHLYSKGGAAVEPISVVWPEAVIDGEVDRGTLKQIIQSDPSALTKIESIVHPLVRQHREAFLLNTQEDICVLDIPLLFETGSNKGFDAIACVYISLDEQRKRVLARGSMTSEQFEMIRAKQLPIEDKLAASDYKIETDTMEHAKEQVHAVIEDIKARMTTA